jgi:hypothetical protein
MSSLWVGLGVGAASLVGGLYSANRAASAQENAADRAAGISQQSSAAQLAFLREQSAQARNDQLPFLSGGTGAYNEFLRQLGVTPAPVARTQQPGTSASGASLIPLPGITTTGQHSQQTSGGGLGGLLSNPLNVTRAGLGGLGANATVTGGPTGQQLFFDRDRRMVVDSGGNLVASVPEGAGTITGLLHGFNNAVRIDENGNLTSVGSRGQNPLNIRLQGLSDAERAALNTTATGTSTTGMPGAAGTGADRYGAYFSSPGYQFLYDETMRASKASGAARGSLYSGAMLKELQNRAAGVASQDYGAYMTRLADAARVGQAAASGTAANATNLGAQGATVIGNAASDQANARLISGASQASSIVGANNAFQSTLGSGLTALGDYYARRGAT